MNTTRIAELLEPFLASANGQRLTTENLAHISTYIDLLTRWNARINLTAIRNEEEIVTRHFGESLFAARHLFPRLPSVVTDFAVRTENEGTNVRVADIGSGAGFPGLPLKIWAPHIKLTLIESNHKKVTFLREVMRALTLMNVDVQNVRVEDLHDNYDVVTLRAVESFTKTISAAASQVAPGGRLALLIGASQLDQVRQLLPHFHWEHPIPIPQSKSRLLIIGTRSLIQNQENKQVVMKSHFNQRIRCKEMYPSTQVE